MDRETVTTYGFLTIATVLMALLLLLSTPVGNRIMTFTNEQINKIIDIKVPTINASNSWLDIKLKNTLLVFE